MRRLDYQTLFEDRIALEDAIHRSDYLAKFCSAYPWQSAALQHLSGSEFGVAKASEMLIVESDGNWLIFAERNPGVFYPFESAWMFGCPLIGDPVATVRLLERVREASPAEPSGFVISGVRENSVMQTELRRLGESALRYEEFDTSDSVTIDLSAGVEAYLERRSRSFRKAIRQLKDIENLSFVDASSLPWEMIFPRIERIQALSHKASAGGDIFSHPNYRLFYHALYRELQADGNIRLLFAVIDDLDVAYILGGVNRHIYRGFQMSYDDNYRRHALGNRLQLENLRRREAEGITHYDLGMHSEYKQRWADEREVYQGAFVVL